MAFLDGRTHKLGRTTFMYDPAAYLAPWRIVSDDGGFEAEFRPVADRASKVDLEGIESVQQEVFGRFAGKARLEDWTFSKYLDPAGFAEDVYDKWRASWRKGSLAVASPRPTGGASRSGYSSVARKRRSAAGPGVRPDLRTRAPAAPRPGRRRRA
jgi:hypothetical protein